MPFFVRPYQSEVTKFLHQLDLQHPELEGQRKAGRQRLWDQWLNFRQIQSYRDVRVKQTAYVYYPNATRSEKS